MPKNSPSKRSGFTLVEILVVIAIIAVLAALLFPVFSSVRHNVHLTSCASNLHQITLGMQMYRQDFDKLPADTRKPSQPWDTSWAPFKSYIRDQAILQCPHSETSLPSPYPYSYRTGPNGTVLNPESNTVVAYCGEHLEYDGVTLHKLDSPNGQYFAGTYVVARVDGSTARIKGEDAPRWLFRNGQWLPEKNNALGTEFVMFRFGQEPWPPRFE